MEKYIDDMTQDEFELKVSLIKTVFGQIKFISEKLKPMPIQLRKDIKDKWQKDGRKRAFGCMFDILYIQSNQYLQALDVSLREHVRRKASERQPKYVQQVGRMQR